MKIGSLFDGSGGFPLAGMQCGMTPIWASEVEPYPIRVTKDKIPGMKHLGSVTEIKGDHVESSDVITFGSPCQDLSVAGKQKGIHEGERSSLFFEAIRIIKEMRAHDRANCRANEHIRPRFAVWENVPGAYSSNGGRDFQAVLQAFCDIGRPGDTVPFPQKGKWANAGCIVGDGYSIAWRTYDAQYWHGTPQRRKRIYLIADFASERAGEILFEQESVSGDTEPCEKKGQGIAQSPDGSIDGSDCGRVIRSAGFVSRQGAKSGSVGYEEEKAPTLRQGITTDCVYTNERGGEKELHVFDITGVSSNSMKSPTPDSCFRERTIGRTLDTFVGSPECNQGGMVVVNAIDCRNLNCNMGLSGTLQAKPNGGYSLNYQNPIVYNCLNPWDNQSARQYTIDGIYETLRAHQGGRCEGIVYPAITGALCANSHPGSYTGQDAYNDMLPVIKSDNAERKWIVRRLTPLECNRLQGFPDGWGCVSEITDLSDEDYAFWLSVRNTHAAINGKKQGNYTKDQMIRWLNGLHTDSAEYKMWGNGIALPCARDVMRRIAKARNAIGMEVE